MIAAASYLMTFLATSRPAPSLQRHLSMRVWDVDPSLLCRSHLLGEHGEVHGVSAVIVGARTGYRAHPEVQRWRGKLPALKKRHDALVQELERRGYQHASPMTSGRGRSDQDVFLVTIPEQLALLARKGCLCRPSGCKVAVATRKARERRD